MIELLLSWIWIGMEAVSLYCFGTAFFKRRLSLRCTLLVLLLYQSFMLIHANALLYKLPLIPEKLLGLLAVALAFAAAFSAPWYGCAAGAAGVFFFSTAVEILLVSLSSALFGISMEDLIWKKAFYALFVTLEKSLELFLCWGLMRLRNRKRNRGRSRRFALLVTLFPLISTFLILFIIQNYRERSDFAFPAVLFSVILILANVFALGLMDSLERTGEAEKELALQHQSAKLQTENYLALEKSYRSQRAASHEFKHQLGLIRDLLAEGHPEEAQRYIDQMQGQQNARLFAVNSGNPIVDAIFNEKYQRAREEGIDIRFQVNDLSQISIQTDDLVVLLSNLLDNAIEACLRLPEGRAIVCSLIREENLLLSIRNTSPAVKIENGRIETSKEPKAEHGFGLAAVRSILTRLEGEYVMDYSEPWFSFVAEIPDAASERNESSNPTAE